MNKILLVEDNEMSRDMLSRRLQKRGYNMILAETGKRAIEMAETAKPDLILMDKSLPVMDGWEATRILKESSKTVGIPIIGLTAHAMIEDQNEAMAAGCDEFETKPIELNRLLIKMKNLLTDSDKKKSISE